MSLIHVSQTKTRENCLYPKLNTDCPVCKSKGSFINNYHYYSCDVCLYDTEMTRGSYIMRFRQNIYRENRKEFAKRLKIKASTLKNYEWGSSSLVVYKRFLQLVRKYKENKNENIKNYFIINNNYRSNSL